MKRCSTCRETKPLEDFNRYKASPDGRDRRCRACAKAWYAANRKTHVQKVRQRNLKHRAELYKFLAEYLRENPCIDCGETDIRVLEFDHRPGEQKLKMISALVAEPASLPKLLREIAKCDVVCANCHRRRTSTRAGFWKEAFHAEQGQEGDAAERLQWLFPAEVP